MSGYIKLAVAILQEPKKQVWPVRENTSVEELITQRLKELPLWKGPRGREEPRRKWALQHLYGLPLEPGKGARNLSPTSIKSQGAVALMELRQDRDFVCQLSWFLVVTPDELDAFKLEKQGLQQQLTEQRDKYAQAQKELEQLRLSHTQMFAGTLGRLLLFLLKKRGKKPLL